jgi:hypothetical protein
MSFTFAGLQLFLIDLGYFLRDSGDILFTAYLRQYPY